ncbi:MAG: putative addiction module antidote protein [Deltaproteobacteria bacterium]|nr:putative addiction module antidote protein [Deltaproteobacteria bacterium]
MNTKNKKARDHEEALLEELKDIEEAAAYLSAALEENDPNTFLLALKRVAKAHGISKIAAKSTINRQHVYRALSEEGNPTIKNLLALLTALHFNLEVKPKRKAIGG